MLAVSLLGIGYCYSLSARIGKHHSVESAVVETAVVVEADFEALPRIECMVEALHHLLSRHPLHRRKESMGLGLKRKKKMHCLGSYSRRNSCDPSYKSTEVARLVLRVDLLS
jgi:hypothetical protein